MRIASIIFIFLLLLFPSYLLAGFSVTYSSSETTGIYHTAVATRVSEVVELTPRELQDSLLHTAAKLTRHYAEIIDGTLSVLSSRTTLRISSLSPCYCDMHFNLTAPISSKTFDPEELRLDIFFDVNGVDMGDLGSVSGMPTGNGRQGIVRIDGITGTQLVHHFGPTPHISLLSDRPAKEDSEVTVVQEFACLLFIAAAFLSAVGHRQQEDRQLEINRRAMRRLIRTPVRNAS